VSRCHPASISGSPAVLRVSRDFDTNRRRNSRQETDDGFNATDYARRCALSRFDPYHPRYPFGFPPPSFPRAHPQPPLRGLVLRPKSRAINHEDYKASTAGDCSLFWVPGERELRGRVVQKNETHFMHYSDPLTAVAPYPRIIRVGSAKGGGEGREGKGPAEARAAAIRWFVPRFSKIIYAARWWPQTRCPVAAPEVWRPGNFYDSPPIMLVKRGSKKKESGSIDPSKWLKNKSSRRAGRKV